MCDYMVVWAYVMFIKYGLNIELGKNNKKCTSWHLLQIDSLVDNKVQDKPESICQITTYWSCLA